MQKGAMTESIVTRNGEQKKIPSEDVVVGDIIEIEKDMRIVADGVLISSNDMSCEESDLTGEPESRYKAVLTQENAKDDPCPFVFRGCVTKTGFGKAIVTAVGYHTNSGKGDKAMDFEEEETPLQLKLERIATNVGKVGVFSAIATFLALIIRLIFEIWVTSSRDVDDPENWTKVIDAVIMTIAIILMAVPEGLPLAVAISLGYSVDELGEKGNLVRKIDASETMGSIDQICTDKTGTLTANVMTVQDLYMGDKMNPGAKFDNIESLPHKDILYQSVVYNSTAGMFDIDVEVNGVKQTEKQIQGNPTEVALMTYLKQSGVDLDGLLKEKNSNVDSNSFLFTTPFDSARKRATLACEIREGGVVTKVRLFVKGAPDVVMEKCTRMLDGTGTPIIIDNAKKANILGEGVIS